MPTLAHHDTNAGPLTVADLDAARRDNPGSIWHPHRHIMPAGLDQQGRHATRPFPDTVQTDWRGLGDCAAEGGTFRDPSPAIESMYRHRRNRITVSRVLVLAVVAYGSHLLWPLLAA